MKAFDYIWLIILLIGIYFTEISRMFVIDTGVSYSIVYPAIILIASLCIIFSKPTRIDKNIIKLSSLVMFTYFVSILHSLSTPFPAKFYYISLFIPSTTAISTFIIVQKQIPKEHILNLLGLLFILICIFYFRNYRNNILLDAQNQNNAAYTILYFLPIILLHKNHYIRYAALLLTGIALLLSLKRAGTLAFVIALIVYLVIEQFILADKKSKTSYIVLFVLGILGVYLIYTNYFVDQGLMMIERFTMNDNGSGRDIIYKTTWELITKSDFLGILCGHGVQGVSMNSVLECSAHNDWMEYYYDFGIFGLLLLASFMYGVISHTIVLIKRHSRYASASAFAVVLICVNSMVSHVFYYEWYFLLISLFFGLLFGLSEKEKYETICD